MTRRILKNFLSFILMAAMLLSMVPAVTITASAASSGEVTGLTNDNVGPSFSGDKEDTLVGQRHDGHRLDPELKRLWNNAL